MKDFETVEMLSKKANVTMEQAKLALEQSGWDVLEAQKVLDQDAAARNAQTLSIPVVPQSGNSDGAQSASFSRIFGRFCGRVKKLVKNGLENDFVVSKGERQTVKFPVLALVILLIAFTFPSCVLLVVGLFFGYSYSFSVSGVTGLALNGAMQKASSAAQQIKDDFKAGVDSTKC